MRLARDHDRHPLSPVRLGEPELDFHAQRSGQSIEPAANGFDAEPAWLPRGLDSHAELAARDLLFQRFDVGVLFEKITGHARDHSGLVPADHRDGGELFHWPAAMNGTPSRGKQDKSTCPV